MADTVVTATTGRALGTRPSRRLRAEGRLPGVVYGLGRDPVAVAVDYSELREALKTDAGLNTVLQLDLDGVAETVIVRDVQRDPIKRWVTHADFMRVDPDRAVRVRVPIHVVGDPVEVECSLRAIPDEIEADVSAMTLDDRVVVGDLVLPDGVTALIAADIAVVAPVVSRAARMAGQADDELLDELAGEELGEEAAGEEQPATNGEAAEDTEE